MLGAKYSTFDPTAVRTMANALDEAWAVMEENGDASRRDPLETRLAHRETDHRAGVVAATATRAHFATLSWRV